MGGGGLPRLRVNADGWGRQLKGITGKALGAEEQTLCRSSDCWRAGAAAGDGEVRGEEERNANNNDL